MSAKHGPRGSQDEERYVWSDADKCRLNRQIFSGMSIFYEDYADHGIPIVSMSDRNSTLGRKPERNQPIYNKAIREFTKEEISEIERDLILGIDRKEICIKYHIKMKTLKNKCKKMGLEWGVSSSKAHPLRDIACQMLIEGATVRQIENELGIMYHLLHRWKAKLKSEGKMS